MTSSDARADSIISFENVRLGFDEGDVLRNLTFSVATGETLALLGETGSGKTLALKLAAGLLQPDSGRVRVLGHNVSSMTEDDLLEFRRQIGFVFQEGALFDSLSVGDNVAYRLREDAVPEEEIEPRVREALRFVELEDALEKLPAELSGGMRRRVSIARALVSRPPVVLYDSPTAGLDPVTSQTIITLLLRLRDLQGVTAILATHRLQDVFALANYRFDASLNRVIYLGKAGDVAVRNGFPPTRFLVLRDGAVYFEGDQRAVLSSPDPYLKRFLV
ncbi:MAG TPA: ATP-binding cassette domain-containing protein [Candidatus Acidoferrales bacterium]|nr:ATP-binding cassette domain-containing protein [Candidatus Acidoferrales bacterium]